MSQFATTPITMLKTAFWTDWNRGLESGVHWKMGLSAMMLTSLRCLRRSLIAGSIACLASQSAVAQADLKIGEPAPELRLAYPFAKPLDVGLSPGRAPGRALMLEFWATWCVPCVEAIPHMNQLVEQFKEEPIDFVAITDEEEPLVRRFLSAHPMEGLIAIDEGGRTGKAYDLTFLPTTVLIDSKGRLAAITNPSHIDADVLKKLIAGEAINLPPPIGLDLSSGPSGGSGRPGALFRAVLRQSLEKEDDIGCVDGKLTIQGASIRAILSRVHGLPTYRIQAPESLDAQRYDALIERGGAPPAELFEMLGHLLPAALNVKIESESKMAPVLVLSVPPGRTTKLKKSAATNWQETGGVGFIRFTATPLSHLAAVIQHELGRDVVDETALSDPYDLNLNWNPDKPESILEAVEAQLGLSIVPGERPMRFLTVRENAGSDAR